MLDKIHLADSYEFIKTIPDNFFDMVHIDPPYLIDRGGATESSSLGKRAAAKRFELADNEINIGLQNEILEQIVRVSKKINCFVWCNKNLVMQLLDFFVTKHGCYFEILNWCKTNPMPTISNTFLPDTEHCLYFREKGVTLKGDIECRKKYWVTPINKRDKDRWEHPTIKPLEIVKQLIVATTDEGDIVADFFIGSGTTVIACQELNRHFVGVEKNPKWHKVACDRLNKIDAHGQQSFFIR
jgi:DNA modification methylase